MLRLGPALICIVILAIGLTARPSAAQSQYIFQTINFQGSIRTGASGINDAGTIVGSYLGADNLAHAFKDVGGVFSNIDPLQLCPSGCAIEANGINNLDEIVGDFVDPSGANHAYYEIGGVPHEFDFPGAGATIALAVNDKGTIVGVYDDNTGSHGFVLSNGQFTTRDCPTGTETEITGINNAGDYILWCGAAGSYKFSTTQGLVALNFPGASVTQGLGINNVGDIVGHYTGADGHFHGFLLSLGNPVTIDPMGSILTALGSINDQGQIVGGYEDSQGGEHSFLADGPELLDPVPDLMAGPAVVNDTLLQALGLDGRTVKGVAADGVTEVVVRIPTQNVGDQFKLTLVNDQNKISQTPDQDGALGNPGDTTFSLNEITVSAIGVNTPGGGTASLAFAVYRVPVDFARQNPDGSYQSGFCQFLNAASGFGVPSNTPQILAGFQPQGDDQAACRTVSISVENLQTGASSSLPVIILRPPVVMIHGLWDNWQAWNNFSPLVSNTNNVDSRFYIGRVSYDTPIGPSIFSSDPPYAQVQLQNATANSLGFAFNAPTVLAQTDGWMENFKQGNNPMGIPAAAVQADLVAHSMGGDIARAMVLQPGFLSDNTFGQGSIHKLITIDTPHLGSPLAAVLLSPQEEGGCIEDTILPAVRHFVFNSVSFGGITSVSGAIGDLSPSSQGLRDVANGNQHPLPTALIAGVYTNFSALDTSARAAFLRFFCGSIADDPLAKNLTSTGWPAVFSGADNDAIVPVTSQVNNSLGSNNAFVFVGTGGYVHSPGTEKLGFAPPSVLDPGDIPNEVVKLLNTPVTQPAFAPLNP